jgi:hypothetical protein
MSSSTVNISDVQDRNKQTLNDIQGLQTIEKDLFNNLEQGLASNSLTTEQKDKIVQKINEISQMRINLYQTMNNGYAFYNHNLSSTATTLTEQNSAIGIVENELNEAKRRMKIIEQEKNNKLRLVEINNYYGQQYSEQTQIMKTVIMICIPILILAILHNREFIPTGLFSILVIVIVVVGVIYLWRQVLYSFSHDNMNYQEYDWYFNKKNAPSIDTNASSSKSNDPWSTAGIICVGQACCSTGNVYDSATNKCVVGTTTTTTTTT